MISLDSHRAALKDRVSVIRNIIDETHPTPPATGRIAREARGMAVVLLFAAYEELLTSLNRSLLEVAAGLRVGNRRLQPGFRAFALHNVASSLSSGSQKKLFTAALPTLVEFASRGEPGPTINPDVFPNDGSFMRRSQVTLWCSLFSAGDPAPILRNIWQQIDTVVIQRNGIAHGRLTPQEVGRSYSEADMRALVDDWDSDWARFLDHIEQLAVARDFYRLPR